MKIECPICDGEGELLEFSEPELGHYSNPCGACDETGSVGLRWLIGYWFWNTVPVWFIEWYGDWIMREEVRNER